MPPRLACSRSSLFSSVKEIAVAFCRTVTAIVPATRGRSGCRITRILLFIKFLAEAFFTALFEIEITALRFPRVLVIILNDVALELTRLTVSASLLSFLEARSARPKSARALRIRAFASASFFSADTSVP